MVEPGHKQAESLLQAAQEHRDQIQFRRKSRLPARRPNFTIASSAHGIPERSRVTGLVFQSILGAAACLALVGVVASTQVEPDTAVSPGSPDAPPPAVFIQLD